jgi:hypothetical protein
MTRAGALARIATELIPSRPRSRPLTHACVRVCAYWSETPAGGALNLALRHSAMVAAGTQTNIRASASDDLRKRMLRSVPSKRVSLP